MECRYESSPRLHSRLFTSWLTLPPFVASPPFPSRQQTLPLFVLLLLLHLSSAFAADCDVAYRESSPCSTFPPASPLTTTILLCVSVGLVFMLLIFHYCYYCCCYFGLLLPNFCQCVCDLVAICGCSVCSIVIMYFSRLTFNSVGWCTYCSKFIAVYVTWNCCDFLLIE